MSGDRSRVRAELRAMVSTVNARLALWLRAERLKRGLTLAEVAGVTGTSIQQIHKYETGANRMSAGLLLVLRHELGLDLDDAGAYALDRPLTAPDTHAAAS